MTKSRSRGMPRRTQQSASQTSRNRWLLIGGGVAVVAIAAVIAILTLGSSGGPSEPAEQPLNITGAALPALPADGTDPAVRSPIPTLAGTGMDGQPMEIGPTGAPQVIVILAHWCPHCQAELPTLVDMINSGEVPSGVSMVGLSTAIDELRGNYPPSAWFDREGWKQPTLIDDANSDGLHALGLTAFPGFVFVDAQGQVVQRMTGEVDRAVLIDAMNALVSG